MVKYWDTFTCHQWTDKELIKKFESMIAHLKRDPEDFSISMTITPIKRFEEVGS